MNYLYIKELEIKEIEWIKKFPKLIRSIIEKVIKKSNIILTKKIDKNKIIWCIPNIEEKNVEKKIHRKIEKSRIQQLKIILSKKIKKKNWNLQNRKIVEGKIIFLEYLDKVLEKILQEELALQDIYFLTNEYNEQNRKVINKIAHKIKSMNIITKEIRSYSRLERTMQEQGIAFCVANNKRKSLKRAKIIVNMNFTNEEINQYTIFRNAMFINLTQEKINLKGFEGIIIQDMKLQLEKEEQEWIEKNNLREDFKQIEIYESIIKEEKSSIHILELYGNNVEIGEKELRNWKKILTNEQN